MWTLGLPEVLFLLVVLGIPVSIIIYLTKKGKKK